MTHHHASLKLQVKEIFQENLQCFTMAMFCLLYHDLALFILPSRDLGKTSCGAVISVHFGPELYGHIKAKYVRSSKEKSQNSTG